MTLEMPREIPQTQIDLRGIEKPPKNSEERRESIVSESRGALDNLQIRAFLDRLDAEDRKKIARTLKLNEITPENLRQLTSMDLLSAEGRNNGSLMLLFGEKIRTEQGKDTLQTFNYKDFEGGKFNKSLRVGDKILINFRGNMDAYWNIGAGDMLPETVRKVKITDNKGNERISTMRQGLRGGFYDAKGYIPVFDNYTIEIMEVWDEKQLADYKKDMTRHEQEELTHLQEIYTKNPGASRGKMPSLEKVFERPDLSRLDTVMDQAMADIGLDASFKPILYSFIKHESGFKMYIKSDISSAYGLFELLEDNWRWTYRDLKNMSIFEGVSYNEFKNSLEGQVYSGILFFKKSNLKTVERILNRPVDPNNPRDVYLLYMAHHEGPGGLRYYLRTGKVKSGVNMITGYAWKVVNGAEYYRQELERIAAAKNGGGAVNIASRKSQSQRG